MISTFLHAKSLGCLILLHIRRGISQMMGYRRPYSVYFKHVFQMLQTFHKLTKEGAFD